MRRGEDDSGDAPAVMVVVMMTVIVTVTVIVTGVRLYTYFQ